MSWHGVKDNQPFTWAAHGFFTLAVPALLAMAAVRWISFVTDLGLSYALWVTAAGLYFVYRESRDETMHRARGDYDTPDDSGYTPRQDKINDAGWPVVCVAATWLAWAMLRGHTLIALILLGVGGVALAYRAVVLWRR